MTLTPQQLAVVEERIVVIALIKYLVDGQLRRLAVSNREYPHLVEGLRVEPLIPASADLSYSAAVSTPFESGEREAMFPSVELINGRLRDGTYILADFARGIFAGFKSEMRRGWVDATWEEMGDPASNVGDRCWRARNARRTWPSGKERVRLEFDSLLAPARGPVNQLVYDEDTPNQGIVNRTIPTALGQIFQYGAPVFDAQLLLYHLAHNVGRVDGAATGGHPTGLFERHGNLVQLLASPNLQPTFDFAGPQAGEDTLVDLLDGVGEFESWTLGEPDGWDVFLDGNATITEHAVGMTVSTPGTGSVNTGWKLATAHRFIGATAGSWLPVGADTIVEAVAADVGDYARARPSAESGTRLLVLEGFDFEVIPDDATITGIELRFTHEQDPDSDVEIRHDARSGIALRRADGAWLSAKFAHTPYATPKTQVTLGGAADTWGYEISVETMKASGFSFGAYCEFAGTSNDNRLARLHQVESRVHYEPVDLDRVRLYKDLNLVPGARYRIRVHGADANEAARVQFSGVAAVGDDLIEPADSFSDFSGVVSGVGTVEGDFIALGSVLGVWINRGPQGTGEQVISQIELIADAPTTDRLLGLLRYVHELAGLDPDETIDNDRVAAHAAAIGDPPLGRLVLGQETAHSVAGLLAHSGAGIPIDGLDGRFRTELLSVPAEPAGPYLVIDDTTITGPIVSQDTIPEQSTERVHAAKNNTPLAVDRTAQVTTTWTEAQRARVIEPYRITRRVKWDEIGDRWPLPSNFVEATGGTVTDIEQDGVNYRVHTFTSDGDFVVTNGGEVEHLVVAGGGCGGTGGFYSCGGGGAGGFLSGSAIIAAATYPVVVGAGGVAAEADSGQGTNGGNSSVFEEAATGGGAGGSLEGTTVHDPKAGGSGGGGGAQTLARTRVGASGTLDQGNDGGDGHGSDTDTGHQAGGGGGGAGAPGQNAAQSVGGDGGAGLESSIEGTAKFYAAGGGGGKRTTGTAGTGGSGIGGNGGAGGGIAGTSGQAETGSGGGGGGSGAKGGDGGSGIVIIRYPIT